MTRITAPAFLLSYIVIVVNSSHQVFIRGRVRKKNILDIDPKSTSWNLNILDDETKEFFKSYGDNKNITPPSVIHHNQELAKTKSSRQVSEAKGNNLVQGFILFFISVILGSSILSGQGDKKIIFLPLLLGIGGGGLIYKSYVEKPAYNNSREAQFARKAKKDNENSQKRFFSEIVTQIKKDAEVYNQFLSLNPTAEQIIEYREKRCLYTEEQEIFDLVLQKIQQKQKALGTMKALGSVVNIGLDIARLNELNEIGNELNEIGNTLSELGQTLEESSE